MPAVFSALRYECLPHLCAPSTLAACTSRCGLLSCCCPANPQCLIVSCRHCAVTSPAGARDPAAAPTQAEAVQACWQQQQHYASHSGSSRDCGGCAGRAGGYKKHWDHQQLPCANIFQSEISCPALPLLYQQCQHTAAAVFWACRWLLLLGTPAVGYMLACPSYRSDWNVSGWTDSPALFALVKGF
jgi:hypothetical protein